jgi:hypothetical protein
VTGSIVLAIEFGANQGITKSILLVDRVSAAMSLPRSLRVLIALVVLLVCLHVALAKVKSGKQTYPNRKELPYAACVVCEDVVKQMVRQTTALIDKEKKELGKRLGEEVILDLTEKVCDPTEDAGEWIARQDLVEQDGRLVLAEQPSFGKCRTECATIEQACKDLMTDFDMTFSELLWKQKGDKRSALTQLICYSRSKVRAGSLAALPCAGLLAC